MVKKIKYKRLWFFWTFWHWKNLSFKKNIKKIDSATDFKNIIFIVNPLK
jgi:hypothetical protein